jgi:hypothetical protein
MKSRLEFRVIADDLGDLHRAIRRAFPRLGTTQREDTYFVGHDPARSWKLRRGTALELKCRLGRSGAFERWAPCARLRLPATGAAIRAAFSLQDDLPVFDLGRTQDAAAVAGAFAGAGCEIVQMGKWRSRYDAVVGTVEFARIETPTRSAQSVCIEGTDRAELEDLRIRLGLGEWSNQSLPDWLGTPALAALPGPALSLARH